MKVKLTQLELVNYRNIGHALYEFDGNSKIVGENRIGKTNTLEAIVWLLTDKLLNGSNDISSIKPLDDTKKVVKVSGTFDLDGKVVTIAKEYGEDWVKTRGTTNVEFKGHFLTYYYNGVKQKTQRDFYALFKEDFNIGNDVKGIDMVRLLVDPFCVGDLGEEGTWKDLRAFIISLIGDVDDSQIYMNNPALRMIESDLNQVNGRIDEVKKQYLNQIKGLNEQILGDDAQIDMLEKTERPSEEDVAVAKKGIQDLDEEIAKLQSEKSSDAAVLDIDKEIQKTRELMLDAKEKALSKSSTKDLENELARKNNGYRSLLAEKTANIEKISKLKTDISVYKQKIDFKNQKKAEFIEKLKEYDNQLANPEFNTICPVCHRPFEGEELAKAREEYLADVKFRREEVLKAARQNKEERELDIAACAKATDELATANLEQQNLANRISESLADIEKTHKAILMASEIQAPLDLSEFENKIQELNQKRATIVADINAANVTIRERIEEKMQCKGLYQKVLDDLAYAERQADQLKIIKKTKADHQKDLANFEQKKELINLFIKTKLSLLDEKVERVFGNIKFQLIKENINGGYDPVCKPYIFDVDKDQSTNVTWKSGSKSERVITGIAICEKIKAALGLPDMPFLFDEGGEISTDTFNTKFKTESQLICVKVMDNIKTPMVMKI